MSVSTVTDFSLAPRRPTYNDVQPPSEIQRYNIKDFLASRKISSVLKNWSSTFLRETVYLHGFTCKNKAIFKSYTYFRNFPYTGCCRIHLKQEATSFVHSVTWDWIPQSSSYRRASYVFEIINWGYISQYSNKATGWMISILIPSRRKSYVFPIVSRMALELTRTSATLVPIISPAVNLLAPEFYI